MDPLRPLLLALTGASSRLDVATALHRLCKVPGVSGVELGRGDDMDLRVGAVTGHRRSTAAGDCVLTVVTDGSALPFDLEELADVLAGVYHRVTVGEREETFAQLFEALVDRVSDGIILATPDGEVLVYNATLERMTGWTHDDVRRQGWTNLVYADSAARAEAQQAIAALTRGVPSDGIERDLRRSDGTSFRGRIWSHVVPRAGRSPLLLGVIRSVAAERTTGPAVVDEHRVASRLAHEFSNLLAAIIGHADVIEQRTTDEALRHHAETIVESALRGGRLARGVLAHEEASSIRTESVDVERLVTSVLDLTRATWPDGVELSITSAPGLPPAKVDSGAIQQVLLNLIGNALSVVGGQGRIEIDLALRAPPASVSFATVESDTEMVAIRVRDDGPGFSTEALDHLFTPMFSERPDGHGLGLAAVRGIVATHEGAIDVFNDDGAVIDLFVPVSRRPQSLVADGARRVWVVDPAHQVLEFARISLVGAGFLMEGHQAVDEVIQTDARPPDVLVVATEARPHLADWLAERPSVRVVWVGAQLQPPYTGRGLVRAVESVDAGHHH